jgi:hypothetical protein
VHWLLVKDRFGGELSCGANAETPNDPAALGTLSTKLSTASLLATGILAKATPFKPQLCW